MGPSVPSPVARSIARAVRGASRDGDDLAGLAASRGSGWRMTIMTSDADTVALLERALEQTAAIIAAMSASEAGLATPCPGSDVPALVRHLTGQDLRNFLA